MADVKASDLSRILQANGWEPTEALAEAQRIAEAAVNEADAASRVARLLVAKDGNQNWTRSRDLQSDTITDAITAAMPDAYETFQVERARSEGMNVAPEPEPESQVQAVTNTVTTTPSTQVAVDPDGHDPEIDKAEESYIRENYPSLAHWLDHPEVGPLIRQASEEGWTESKLAAKLEPTDWYQSTSSSEREFVNRYNRNPGELQRDIDQQRFMLESVARTQGITMSDQDLELLATDIIKYGYSEQEILRQLGTRVREQDAGPSDGLLNIEQQLRSMAKQYQLKFDDATLKEYATRIFEGTWSQDAARATFQQQATQFYPHLADQLEKGVTVEDYFAPIKARVASILEMNPNDIDMSEGKWASLGQFVDDKGRMRAPTFAEIDQFARDQDEYGYTKQGITSGYEKMNSMFRTLGVIK